MEKEKKRRFMCYASGAMRGVYYAGVMRAMTEAGVDFDEFAGISVGSTGAAWHAAGQGITGLDTWLAIKVKKLTLHPFFNNSTDKNLDWMIANDTLPRLDADGLKKSGKTIHIGVSEIKPLYMWGSGMFRKRYLSFKGEFEAEAVHKAIRASCHMPFINGIFSSTVIDGMKCLDGGLTGRIPLDAVDLYGFDEIWLAAASPNAIRELDGSIPHGIRDRLNIITPSMPIPIRRIEIDKDKFRETAAIGYRDTMDAIARKEKENRR